MRDIVTRTAKSIVNAHISEETECRTSEDKSTAEAAHSSLTVD